MRKKLGLTRMEIITLFITMLMILLPTLFVAYAWGSFDGIIYRLANRNIVEAEKLECHFEHNLPYQLNIEDRAFMINVSPQNDAEVIVIEYFYSTIKQDRYRLSNILADGVQIGYADETSLYYVFDIYTRTTDIIWHNGKLLATELNLVDYSFVTASFARIIGALPSRHNISFLVGRVNQHSPLQIFGFEYVQLQLMARTVVRTVFDYGDSPYNISQMAPVISFSHFADCICDKVFNDCNYVDYSEIDYRLYRWGVHHRRNDTVNPMLRAASRYFRYSIDYVDGFISEGFYDVLGNADMHEAHTALILNEQSPFSHMLYPGHSMSFGIHNARIVICGDSSKPHTTADILLRSLILQDWDEWLLLIEHHDLTQYALVYLEFMYTRFPLYDDVFFNSGRMNRLLLVGRTQYDNNWRVYEVARAAANHAITD